MSDKIMKKSHRKKNKKFMLPVILLIIVITLTVVLILLFRDKPDDEKNKESSKKNRYSFVEGSMYDRAKSITSSQLRQEHCLGSVCVKDLMIYRFDDRDDVVLKVVNKGNEEATGQLNVVFADMVMPVVYQNLSSGNEKVYTLQFDGLISSYDDYSVRELTSDELGKIKID